MEGDYLIRKTNNRRDEKGSTGVNSEGIREREIRQAGTLRAKGKSQRESCEEIYGMNTSKIPEHTIPHDIACRYCTERFSVSCEGQDQPKVILTSGIQKELEFSPPILVAAEVLGICSFPWRGKLCSSEREQMCLLPHLTPQWSLSCLFNQTLAIAT